MIGKSNIKEKIKAPVFKELHMLLAAGMDFGKSFELLIECEDNKTVRKMLSGLYSKVAEGSSLWSAMHRSALFSPIDYGVVRVGEETGKLPDALSFLSDYYQKKLEREKMIKSAVSYPVVIILTAITVVIFMIMVIVPMFEQVYLRMGRELPNITRFVIELSEKAPIVILFISGSAIMVGLWLVFTKDSEDTQRRLASFLLSIPLIGNIIRKNHQLSFCKLLSLLNLSGVPLLQSINMLGDIIVFYPYKKSFQRIASDLEQGEQFAMSISHDFKLYGRKLVALLKVGEETNTLGLALLKHGDTISVELEYEYKMLGTMLEPILIIFVGGVVAFILIAMYMPMFKLQGVIY